MSFIAQSELILPGARSSLWFLLNEEAAAAAAGN